jgi:hypothetical protein
MPAAQRRMSGQRPATPSELAPVPDLDFGGTGAGARSPFAASRMVDFEDEDTPNLPIEPQPTRGARPAPQQAPARTGFAPQAGPQPPPPRAMPDMGRGAVFDADDEAFGGGGELSLELDVKPGQGRVTSGGLAASGPPKAMAAHGVGGQYQPITPSVPAAPQFSPLPAALADRGPAHPPVEAFEARVLGNFGDPPSHWWQTPLYAWRVRQRLADLREELAERERRAERATAAAEQALIALGQRARSTAEKIPAYGRTVDGIRLQEQTLRQKDSALMAENDAHNKKLSLIDAKISELHTQLAMVQAEERRVADELAVAQATMQRAEAKLKRLDMELRSILGPAADPGPRRGGP